MAEVKVTEPFPIFLVAHRYLLYDVNTVTYARRTHNITGVLIGGLPQAPQQNVFLGIPLELMPEEARLLVEKDAAYVVDDVAAHKKSFLANGLGAEEKQRFLRGIERQGAEAARKQASAAGDRKLNALKKIAEKKGMEVGDWNDIPDDMFAPRKPKAKAKARSRPVPGEVQDKSSNTNGDATSTTTVGEEQEEEESLFGVPSRPPSTTPSERAVTPQPTESEPFKITPTISYPPLSSTGPPPASEALPLPPVPSSYPLFKHLHSQGYFLMPGLRFGCQYNAYPGDPLRFHSHYLCNGMDWDEEFELLDLVGGGRLGTGVKKAFLIGGLEKKDGGEQEDKVKTCCIEWAGM